LCVHFTRDGVDSAVLNVDQVYFESVSDKDVGENFQIVIRSDCKVSTARVVIGPFICNFLHVLSLLAGHGSSID
jgi:hypothetical protein